MSTPINDGGSDFPLYLPQEEGDIRHGMTLRDWFAGQALAGMLSSAPQKFCAVDAYTFADAMLKAREVKP